MSVRVLSTAEDKHGVEGGWAISHSGAFHLLGSWLLKVTSAHVQILGLITRIFRIFLVFLKYVKQTFGTKIKSLATKGASADLKWAFCAFRIEAVLLFQPPREHKAGRCISGPLMGTDVVLYVFWGV